MDGEEEEECTSLLIGEMPLDPPDMAGAMSFLPKLSRLLETLLMLREAVFVPVLELGEEQSGFETGSENKGLQRKPQWWV